MIIETMFDVGQVVWIMFNNEPETWQVQKIILGDVSNPNYRPMITYDLVHQGKNHVGCVHEINEMEYKIHATKRDLLNSFLTDED